MGLIVTALIALGAALIAAVVTRDSGRDSATPVAAALEPVPEGPVVRLTEGDPQWSELSLPANLPEPLPQPCDAGLNVVVTLADGTRHAFGPCERPRVIELLRADLLSVTRNEALRVIVAPGCARLVLSDWFDNGRVDRLYRRVCYEGALDLLPEGWEDPAGMEGAIRRALCAWALCKEHVAVPKMTGSA